MRLPSTVVMFFAAAMALGASGARAADSGSEARLREALRSTSSQLRALENERAQWQASEAEQKRELEELRKQLAEAQKPHPAKVRDRCPSDLRSCEDDQQIVLAAASRLREELSQCEAAARAATAAQEERRREEESARSAAAAQVAALSERGRLCQASNEKMFDVAKKILDQLWKNGGGEPLLGLKRVEVENFAQDAEDKLLEAKVKP